MLKVIIRRTSPSDGARNLKNKLVELGARCLLSDDGRARRRALLINWGSTQIAEPNVINKPISVAIARNKVSTFRALAEAGFTAIPKFWTNREEAERERGKAIILERHTVTGESGAGIVVKRQGEALSPAPLYVQYIRKNREFRVHVFAGQAIAVQQKRRESDTEQTNDQKLIRNRANGWVFCVNDVQEPASLRELAVAACNHLMLDFGAVDMVEDKHGNVFVLEINTKPGIESPTVLEAYANRIMEIARGRQGQ